MGSTDAASTPLRPLREQLQWPGADPSPPAPGLSRSDLQWVYTHLVAPPTHFDCGTRCGPTNGGLPVCCGQETTVPVLYEQELAFLAERTKLWTRWQPLSWFDGSVDTTATEGEVLAFCKGVQHCERDNRSIVCRTFPFDPYTTNDGEILGLVYNRVLGERCWLHDRHGLIRGDFVRQNLAYWHLLFDRLPSEAQAFVRASAQLRRHHGRNHLPLLVLRPEGIFEAPTREGARPLRLVAPLEGAPFPP